MICRTTSADAAAAVPWQERPEQRAARLVLNGRARGRGPLLLRPSPPSLLGPSVPRRGGGGRQSRDAIRPDAGHPAPRLCPHDGFSLQPAAARAAVSGLTSDKRIRPLCSSIADRFIPSDEDEVRISSRKRDFLLKKRGGEREKAPCPHCLSLPRLVRRVGGSGGGGLRSDYDCSPTRPPRGRNLQVGIDDEGLPGRGEKPAPATGV